MNNGANMVSLSTVWRLVRDLIFKSSQKIITTYAFAIFVYILTSNWEKMDKTAKSSDQDLRCKPSVTYRFITQ